MANLPTTHVLVDDAYVALVGKAVYVFAYYEWAIIWVIELLQPGFVAKYSREEVMISGAVHGDFLKALNDLPSSFEDAVGTELRACCATFKELIVKRNALIHAHPATDSDGQQILVYQTQTTKPLPDMKWPRPEIECAILEFDAAACTASNLLERLTLLRGYPPKCSPQSATVAV